MVAHRALGRYPQGVIPVAHHQLSVGPLIGVAAAGREVQCLQQAVEALLPAEGVVDLIDRRLGCARHQQGVGRQEAVPLLLKGKTGAVVRQAGDSGLQPADANHVHRAGVKLPALLILVVEEHLSPGGGQCQPAHEHLPPCALPGEPARQHRQGDPLHQVEVQAGRGGQGGAPLPLADGAHLSPVAQRLHQQIGHLLE